LPQMTDPNNPNSQECFHISRIQDGFL